MKAKSLNGHTTTQTENATNDFSGKSFWKYQQTGLVKWRKKKNTQNRELRHTQHNHTTQWFKWRHLLGKDFCPDWKWGLFFFCIFNQHHLDTAEKLLKCFKSHPNRMLSKNSKNDYLLSFQYLAIMFVNSLLLSISKLCGGYLVVGRRRYHRLYI